MGSACTVAMHAPHMHPPCACSSALPEAHASSPLLLTSSLVAGAPSGVKVTRVGYCGGSVPDPTYKRVCRDPKFSDWAECVQVDFDEAEVSFEDLCRLFFQLHDPSAEPRKRQYMSAIFAHTDRQFETANRVLDEVRRGRPARVSTKVERATDFFEGEFYHQKWLLQRKAEWFKSLGLADPRELIEGEPASKINAHAGGHVPKEAMRAYLNDWIKRGVISKEAYKRLSVSLS